MCRRLLTGFCTIETPVRKPETASLYGNSTVPVAVELNGLALHFKYVVAIAGLGGLDRCICGAI